MLKIKAYLHANLYLILPPLFIIVFMIMLTPAMNILVKPWVLRTASACSFSNDGGSLNACTNAVYIRAILTALLPSGILAWIVSSFCIRSLGIRWRSSFIGVAAFYLYLSLIVASIWFYGDFLDQQNIFGTERTQFSQIVVSCYLVTTLAAFAFISARNFREYVAAQTYKSKVAEAR